MADIGNGGNGVGVVTLKTEVELPEEEYVVLLGILRTTGRELAAHIRELLVWEVETRKFYGGSHGLVGLTRELIREHALANTVVTPARAREMAQFKQTMIRIGLLEAE